MLAVDAFQQGLNFLIGLVLQGMLQIQIVEGAGDPLCHPASQQRRQGNGKQRHQRHGCQHSQHQIGRGGLIQRNPQYRAVGELLRLIDGSPGQGVGVADRGAVAGFHGIPDFLPGAVVFHGGFIAFAVVDHRSVGVHPGQPEPVVPGCLQIGKPGQLRAGGGQVQFIPQLPALDAVKIIEKHTNNHTQAAKQHHHSHKQGGAKNLSCHSVSPTGSPHCARSQSGCRSAPASAEGFGCAYPRCGSPPENPCPTPD